VLTLNSIVGIQFVRVLNWHLLSVFDGECVQCHGGSGGCIVCVGGLDCLRHIAGWWDWYNTREELVLPIDLSDRCAI
jgi:hypothetical protein